jgi:hypothetical protein
VYEATGQIVKAQAGYAAFCNLELQLFNEVNQKPKATQPVSSIGRLVRMSARAAPAFHAAMAVVVAEVNGARMVPVGGLVYKPAPLKEATRILEKLSLDPGQAQARVARDVGALDASGILDAVRGMFVCSTMMHAVELLKRLAAHAKADAFELVRSKNRFAR